MSETQSTAQTAAADVVELVCHEEQLQVWADELLGDLALGCFLREDMDYDDNVNCHRTIRSEIKRIVSLAFDHPEAAAEITRLRAEVDVAYAHGVTAGADAERKRLEPEIERLRAALRPFAELALTKTVAHGYQAGVLLTLSNGEKMCAVDPRAILNAHAALE